MLTACLVNWLVVSSLSLTRCGKSLTCCFVVKGLLHINQRNEYNISSLPIQPRICYPSTRITTARRHVLLCSRCTNESPIYRAQPILKQLLSGPYYNSDPAVFRLSLQFLVLFLKKSYHQHLYMFVYY